ncbi:MAG: DNA-processing protein DprA [Woronichinia naegeliana WA131]|uniref:DNA-processing protein DprA n=1 Tax=Woronichinia naegeliana WA131 TaxID=2824559 RepID=A0A977KU11_9CYAN|nr:MAG: DNA-processing protein DprA [Woronichinia naegeliana WA131]
MNEDRYYWLAWSQINGVGPVLLKRIQQHFETLENAWKASERALLQVNGLGSKLITNILTQRSQLNPQLLLEEHSRQNPHFWTPADADYPRLLWEIPSPPPVLYYRGQVKMSENQGQIPGIAIVGTRFPTEHGKRWTKKISMGLAKSDFTVISGLAAGIDGQAHRSCLEAGGRTIAVLGTGLDLVYPPQNRQLFEEIAEKGLILSEYPVGTKPDRGNFPARNRIIAGLSRAILVMEAPEKSGSLITARYANEFCRDVYTLPNSPDVAEAKGCLTLIHNGAEVILSEETLLETLGAIPKLDIAPVLSLLESLQSVESLPDLDPIPLKILQAVPRSPTPFDTIIQNTGLSTGEVSAGLLQLELMGLVSQIPGMRYQRL